MPTQQPIANRPLVWLPSIFLSPLHQTEWMPCRVQIDAKRVSAPIEGRGSNRKYLPLCLVEVLHPHIEVCLLWYRLPRPLRWPVVRPGENDLDSLEGRTTQSVATSPGRCGSS
jgi:hypothetical protein